MIACADCGEGKDVAVPRLLELGLECEDYQALPYGGGVMDQPAGLLNKMRRATSVYRAFKVYEEQGRRPGESAKWKKEHAAIWNIISWVNGLKDKYG